MSIRTGKRWLFFMLFMAGICTAGIVLAQSVDTGVLDAGKSIAGMSAQSLLGAGLIVSLSVSLWLIKFITTSMTEQIQKSNEALQKNYDALIFASATTKKASDAVEFCKTRQMFEGKGHH